MPPFNLSQRVSRAPTNPKPAQTSRGFDVADLYQGQLDSGKAAAGGPLELDEKLRQAYFWIVNNAIISPHYDIEYYDAPPQTYLVRDTKQPVGYVSGQAEDGYKPAVVLVTPENHWAEDPSTEVFHPKQLRSLVPAGRLDIDSVGLLVLTQDGRVAKQLIGQDTSIEKEYLVRVQYTKPGTLPDADLRKLNHGLWMDGKPLLPAKVRWQNEDQLSFTLKEDRKRQIRRMCDMVGLKVLGLKRVRIGKVKLGDLPPGQWRYLRPDEQF